MAMVDALARSELFGRLHLPHLEKLSPLCRGLTYAPGDTIFKEGEKDRF